MSKHNLTKEVNDMCEQKKILWTAQRWFIIRPIQLIWLIEIYIRRADWNQNFRILNRKFRIRYSNLKIQINIFTMRIPEAESFKNLKLEIYSENLQLHFYEFPFCHYHSLCNRIIRFAISFYDTFMFVQNILVNCKDTYKNICGVYALLIRNYPNSGYNVIITIICNSQRTVPVVVHNCSIENNSFTPTFHVLKCFTITNVVMTKYPMRMALRCWLVGHVCTVLKLACDWIL